MLAPTPRLLMQVSLSHANLRSTHRGCRDRCLNIVLLDRHHCWGQKRVPSKLCCVCSSALSSTQVGKRVLHLPQQLRHALVIEWQDVGRGVELLVDDLRVSCEFCIMVSGTVSTRSEHAGGVAVTA